MSIVTGQRGNLPKSMEQGFRSLQLVQQARTLAPTKTQPCAKWGEMHQHIKATAFVEIKPFRKQKRKNHNAWP